MLDTHLEDGLVTAHRVSAQLERGVTRVLGVGLVMLDVDRRVRLVSTAGQDDDDDGGNG